MSLELRDITVTFPDGESTITPLDGVNLTLEPGTVTVVTGESGSGKSTLLSVAAGLLEPTSGTATLDGEPINETVRRDKIGLVFQRPNLLASLTVREQLLITNHIRGEALDEKRADAVLHEVGMEAMANKQVQKLSGGQQQRVNIARAMMGDPVAVLADEPTSALDPSLSGEIMELIARFTRERGLATLIITHDHSQLGIADRVFELHAGVLKEPVASA
ncbi:ABC transporter ATP-binding protein [Corynebacterium renale]|uniref:Putative ABC transport system ATP-binding protein n=1 Tax=Corynebacterium renale TaxID=1724 RepID=A0A2A9DKJ2_9CORY|nr:ABC transporter ATP-binding protein [Corynebacterium renale]PFG27267.1 putative ABC transport system ATP-binding protein [Corynebacterium renale]SQI23647.1 ABC transporter system involved in hemin toxicity ATP-binding protein [Corynebacterium renale]